MSKPLKGALVRFVRVFIAVVISGAVVQVTNNPQWVVLAPVLSALGKWLRAKYKIPYTLV